MVNLEIKPLKNHDLYNVISIDHEIFNRLSPRSAVNLKGLYITDPQGCFALWDNDKLVGYSFCRTMGSEGYLGPVGILPRYQKKGYGKKLISATLKYLKLKCSVIGLETQPEAGANLGLYHKMGFKTGFPSLILQLPDSIISGKLCQIESISKMDISQQHFYLDTIDNWTRENLEGISYKRDLSITNKSGGIVLVAQKSGEPYGFLASFKSFFPHIWGVVETHRYQDEILISLLSNFRKSHGPGAVLLEVNTRYQKLVEILLKNDFKIKKSVNRMLLTGYEGKHMETSQDLIFRSWHA
jgi:GNAT superfamily N-acetyltransferase